MLSRPPPPISPPSPLPVSPPRPPFAPIDSIALNISGVLGFTASATTEYASETYPGKYAASLAFNGVTGNAVWSYGSQEDVWHSDDSCGVDESLQVPNRSHPAQRAPLHPARSCPHAKPFPVRGDS